LSSVGLTVMICNNEAFCQLLIPKQILNSIFNIIKNNNFFRHQRPAMKSKHQKQKGVLYVLKKDVQGTGIISTTHNIFQNPTFNFL